MKDAYAMGALLQAAGIGLFEYRPDTGEASFDQTFEAIAGCAPGASKGHISFKNGLIEQEDAPRAAKCARDLECGIIKSYEVDYRMLKPDGSVIHVRECAVISERDGKQRPTRISAMLCDITKERREGEAPHAALWQAQRKDEALAAHEAAHQPDSPEALRGAIFDANPYINIICDETLNVIDCNEAALKYFGFASKADFMRGALQKIIGSIPVYQADGRSSVSIQERILQAVREGSAAFETELTINGRALPLNIIIKRVPYRDAFALVIYMIDLHALKETKANLVRRDRMLSAANKAAALLIATSDQQLCDTILQSLKLIGESVDADKAFLYHAAAIKGKHSFSEVCQWERDGKKTEPFLSERNSAAFYDKLETLMAGESIRAGAQSGSPTDNAPHAGIKSLLIAPVSLLGEFWGFIGFLSTTAFRQYDDTEESILKSIGMMLASAIQREEMTESLVRAKEEALASTNAKTEFLSRMSHEIRTPMNAIIGMTAIALKADDLTRIRHCLANIDSSSRQLLNIINDVLDMSKIEANKFEINLHEFDFEQMMRSVFNVIHGKVEEKRQDFNLDLQSVFTRNMISDELRLSQVLINLLNNAVKFTPEGGCITLRVRETPCAKDASMLRVEVADSGIGISENQIDKLFRSFEQADGSITRKYGGSGLGLSICKKIITLMGGEIWAQSAPGEGSRFSFEVRVSWGGSCRHDLELNETTGELSVLVVDDQADVLDYFKNILRSFSIPCDAAASGREGMHLALEKKSRGEAYDLIFIDWMMPEWSGAVTAKEIKKIFPDVTIVMISGMDWEEIGKAVEPYGITHFLPKPILPSVLFNTVVKLTRNTLVTKKAPIEVMPDWKDKRLLLVEDIEVNREIIMSILEETRVKIEAACDGLQAVEMYRRDPDRYDLILMDLQMPVLDGLGATRQIRASKTQNAKSIPIVAMTANAFKEDVDACLRAGMNNHVAKPIEIDALLTTLISYLGQA